jgi:DcuC family C4-dicarboxylate transporter
MSLFLGLLVIAAAVFAVIRRVDVRLALLLAALALGALGGDVPLILRTFFVTFCKEQFVVPICCATGFGFVLRHTQCDQHLVQLMVRPLRNVRFLLIPGVVLVGFFVNSVLVSQVGTAVSIGTVLVPLLRRSGVSPLTTGAALLLGASLGGDLLNPGAPEWRTIGKALDVEASECIQAVLPLLFVQLAVATSVFWLLSRRAETRHKKVTDARTPIVEAGDVPEFHINPLKAAVPVVPLVLLFLVSPPYGPLSVSKAWLVDLTSASDTENFESRLIGAAMVIGSAMATMVAWRQSLRTARAFCEGAGYGFAHIISIIVAATCFGKGVELLGVGELLLEAVNSQPWLLLPIAGYLPLSFAALCGSGMATTQSLFGLFVYPARQIGMDPMHVGAVVAIAASAGRTMSPVAAITLMSATLTETNPLSLVRRVVLPLMVAVGVTLVVAIILAKGG